MKPHTCLCSSFISIILVLVVNHVESQGTISSCDARSCYPAIGDLLIGRKEKLSSSSTCGHTIPQPYCIVSHLQDDKKCFTCDSRQSYQSGVFEQSHLPENMVTSFSEDRMKTWWQSENGVEWVQLRFDLEAQFHFTHLIMTFKTFRPAAMLIERSSDFGQTWQTYQYFAYDCETSFNGAPIGTIQNLGQVVCNERYSAVEPSSGGEVIFRVIPPNLIILDPYTSDVQNLLTITNLRINFTKLHTLGDNLLDNRPEIKEKYYYAILEMVVRGRCMCYGHAERCSPPAGVTPMNGMVYGNCDCLHNTEGNNCEKCMDFYFDAPWRPAVGVETNACQLCECHNHATQCHFDPAVWASTGETSGGVCDNCQHNTMGRNCEQCKPFYYLDPRQTIDDSQACLACDCDPVGTLNGGECEGHTDVVNSLEAGRCICKTNIAGYRCDVCEDGYWLMDSNNPDGCQECSCNLYGTVGNHGCDKDNGECTCKRLVAGLNCDQCLPEHWGLSSEDEGCKICDCDAGGSYDNNCNPLTGQCSCRPHVLGRRCDQVEPGYCTPTLDSLIYEAEQTFLTPGTAEPRVRVANRPVTWTGEGFVSLTEGSSIEFIINNIPMSKDYEILIRYEPYLPETWEEISVNVQRPGDGLFIGATCGNTISTAYTVPTSLPAGSRFILLPALCLEQSVTYTIVVAVGRYHSAYETPNAKILLDSLVLVPSHTDLPMFQGSEGFEQRTEFERYRCKDIQLSVIKPSIPEVCKSYTRSINALIYGGGTMCDCDATGSLSYQCESFGCQCSCRPNVIGHDCSECSPATYAFGPAGCTACECDSDGSVNSFCNVQTGQCECHPNTYGRSCDLCQPTYWNFPDCQPCQCNGHTTSCDPSTGYCNGCGDHTVGVACQICESGYYGDPRLGLNKPCEPCPCPGGLGSVFQYADTCYLEPGTQAVICACETGYTGDRCEQCADGYFGSPLVPGGQCRPCSCSNNTDPYATGICDTQTGECLKCIYNTDGPHCEVCASGYYGNALTHDCKACVCNRLGTDETVCDSDRVCGTCDLVTGQCPCLPNVIGRACDLCAPDHWDLASDTGCEQCSCCPDGSYSSQCNELDGQCRCRPGFGARDCCQCETNFWGNPRLQCYACDCDRDGSETLQCNRTTGDCICKPGVTGDRCDQCERGTSGVLPLCEPCGECFQQWDTTIQFLLNETLTVIDLAENIQVTGATGAYNDEFKKLEDTLKAVDDILNDQPLSGDDIDTLKNQLDRIRAALAEYSTDADDLSDAVDDIQRRTDEDNEILDEIESRLLALMDEADQLKKNASAISGADIEGAMNLIRDAADRSEAAKARADGTDLIVEESELVRAEVEDILSRNQDQLQDRLEENERELADIQNNIDDLEDKLTQANTLVCGSPGDQCGSCGGAGCGFCGGLGCGGVMQVAQVALEWAQQADQLIQDKNNDARELQDQIDLAILDAEEAKLQAQMAYDLALQAKQEAEGAQTNLTQLLLNITDYLNEVGARPDDIKSIAEYVLTLQISLTPDEITALARQINETIANLTNIDRILNNTRVDLDRARKLKDRADDAKQFADDMLDKAQGILDDLAEAERAQEAAEKAIGDANKHIEDGEDDLTQIGSEMSDAMDKVNNSMARIKTMKEMLPGLISNFTGNKLNVESALAAAYGADRTANDTLSGTAILEFKFNEAETLYNQTKDVQDFKTRAEKLRDDATTLDDDLRSKLTILTTLQMTILEQELYLNDLTAELEALNIKMTELLTDIDEKSRFYRTCT